MDLRDKKILITGGSGFLGQALRQGLEARGVNPQNISAPNSREYDLRSIEECRRIVKGIDLVIHSAAMTGNADFHAQNPGEIFYNNLMMGIELMEAAREADVKKIITIGSATEYPENAPFPLKEDDLWIGPILASHAPYTTAKKMLSVQGAAYRKQYGINAVHVVMTNMYGPGEAIESEYVIPSLIKRIWNALHSEEKAQKITVWGTGEETRDFIYIKDAVEGILSVGERYDSSLPVNIASGKEIKIKDVAGTIADMLGFHGEIVFDASKSGGHERRVLDITRAEREVQFIPKTEFKAGLEETVRYCVKTLEKQ
jgi:GDP-L-fucose synthase